jgi:hypothetical protein
MTLYLLNQKFAFYILDLYIPFLNFIKQTLTEIRGRDESFIRMFTFRWHIKFMRFERVVCMPYTDKKNSENFTPAL